MAEKNIPSSDFDPETYDPEDKPKRSLFFRFLKWFFVLLLSGIVLVALLLALGFAVAYPKLPDVADLQNYRPKLPLRIYSGDGKLLAEYSEERRILAKIQDIPACMKNAVIAIEDARFYKHGGVDFVGIARAGVANLSEFKSQGASTITMQVARNVYLTSEKTFARKLYEIMLTFKMESVLSKEQILEIYMNQIYLGNRSYGFATAAESYFAKSLKDLTLAECALLAGLPKAPSAYNPLRNYVRAKERQEYVLDRMRELGMVSAKDAQEAKAQPLAFGQRAAVEPDKYMEYPVEMARQIIMAQYKDEAYTRGLNVYTTVKVEEQRAAYDALRRSLRNYDRSHSHYRGPERFVEIPEGEQEAKDVIADTFNEVPDSDTMRAAVVLSANPNKVVAEISSGETVSITGLGLRGVGHALYPSASAKIRIRRGAVIRVQALSDKNDWGITQVPEVQGALVSMSPKTGAIRAVMGGYDYSLGQFNRASQAWRQPGSSFKPFIYSAALEHGISTTTLINDSPIKLKNWMTGWESWSPKNSDGNYEGPITMRRALTKSKNMVAVRLLQKIQPEAGQRWIMRFGFPSERHPPYLSMALGTGLATPLQMATAYCVFANGGYRLPPWIIEKITDFDGNVVSMTKAPPLDDSTRAISERNAFVISSLMNDVTRVGTAKAAQANLGRRDLYGKTGTTNDVYDAWFVGFQPSVVAAAWMGFDNPRTLGDRESGGALSLPMWIEYMRYALRNVPVTMLQPPKEGLVRGADWIYTEQAARGPAIRGVGLNDRWVGDKRAMPPGLMEKQLAAQRSTRKRVDPDAPNTAPPVRKRPKPPSQEREAIRNLFEDR